MSYIDIKSRHRPSDHSLVGYDTIKDIESIRTSLTNLFLIQTGEVPGKPWYGNALFSILFDPIDQFTRIFIEKHVENQIEKYEPRVKLLGIEIITVTEFNRIDVKIDYSVQINDYTAVDSILMRDLNTIVSTRIQEYKTN